MHFQGQDVPAVMEANFCKVLINAQRSAKKKSAQSSSLSTLPEPDLANP